MKNENKRKDFAFGLLIFLLVILSIKGLITMAQFLGYAAYNEAEGGTITELDLRVNFDVSHWSALYGTAWGTGFSNDWEFNLTGNTTLTQDKNEKHMYFECFEPNIDHELYASMVPLTSIDFDNMQAATAAEFDNYMNVSPAEFYSATNTFIYTATFDVGGTSITAPATYTYRQGLTNTTDFVSGILKDSGGNLVIVTKVGQIPIEGYNFEMYNYQILLPIQNSKYQMYYIWSDPTDSCTMGNNTMPAPGWVYGNVTDTSNNPLGEAIIEVAGAINLSLNTTGEYTIYNVPEGNQTIYAFKTGYRVYRGDVFVIANNGTVHNIILVQDQPPNPPLPGIGPGIDAPGDQTQTGVGPGQTDKTKSADYDLPPVLQRPKKIEGTDYIVSISEINRKLRLGNFLQEKITLYSFKEKTANIEFKLEGNISKIMKLDRMSMMLQPRSADFLTATMFGVGDVGTYNGSIVMSGDFNVSIPVTIEILPRDKLPVEAMLIDLELSKKNFYPGELVKFKTDLKNLLTDQQYPVRLFFTIQDLEGKETLWNYETNVLLKTSFSIIKTAQLPTSAKPGDYVLRVSANYLDLNSASSQIFKIDTPWYLVYLIGPVQVWHLLLFLLLAAAIAGIVWDVKRRIESKKKFHLKVELNEIPKVGPRSIWVGKIAETDTKTYFNMESFMTHCIDAGSTGSGKSVSAQVIVEEMLLKNNVAVICFDPTAQWTGMLRKQTDKTMLSLYPYYGMKPSDARAFNGNIRMITNPREIIDIKKYARPGEIQIFACHKLEPKDMDIFVANSIRQIFRANYGESRTLKVLFVYDEVHRLLPKFGGSGEGFLQIERGCREFRKWGLGVLLISQVLSDFVGTIKANINTEIQMRTRDEGDLERIRVKYGDEVLRSLVKATIGSGMVENPQYNRGKPYFVAFKPLMHNVQRMSDEEIEKYNEYNDKIEQMQYELEELEKMNVDVFDLKLELKLALDKVKTGSFNMVQIYLDGLTPRVKKHWDKLGKVAPKLEKQVISESDLKADLEKARQAREAYEAEQKKGKAAVEGEVKEVDIYKRDVSPDKLLKLVNGMLVINMASLYDEIAAMKEDDFAKHVNFQKNDFSDWLRNGVGDVEMAELLKYSLDKKEMLSFLELRKMKKAVPKPDPANIKKYDDAKAAWEAAKKAEEDAKKKKTEEEEAKKKKAASAETFAEFAKEPATPAPGGASSNAPGTATSIPAQSAEPGSAAAGSQGATTASPGTGAAAQPGEPPKEQPKASA